MDREMEALFEAFLQKSPSAQRAFIARLEQTLSKPTKREGHTERLKRNLQEGARKGADFVIWTGLADELEVRSEYVSLKQAEAYIANKSNYDIFISGQTVLVNGELVVLPPRLDWLLIIFLRYRNQFLPSAESFQKAWGHSALLPSHDVKSILQNYLRFAVSDLRQKLQPLITAGKLSIPNKHRDHGYRCEGRFSFCIIVERGLESRATVRII